MIWENLDRTKD